MVAGGLPVLGGRNSCPQVAGPFFSGLAAGRDWRGLAGGGGDGEERVREHRQRDVPVPGAVAADLVVIKAGLVLGGLDAGLNRPPLMPMKRRPIETGNKQLKTYLRGPGKVLRSQSPDMVRQEIYGYLLTHYAISALTCKAATEAGVDPDRVKFRRTVRILRRRVADPAFSP